MLALRDGFEGEGLFSFVGPHGEPVGGSPGLKPCQSVVFLEMDLEVVLFIALDDLLLFKELDDALDNLAQEVTQLGLGWSFSCVPATGLSLPVQLIDSIQVELVEVDIEVDPILTTLSVNDV